MKNAILQQSAVVDCYPTSKSAAAFKLLGKTILDWPVEPIPKGHITFFLEKLVAFQQGDNPA